MYKRIRYYMLDSVKEVGWPTCRNLRNKKKRNFSKLSPLHRKEFKINPGDLDLTVSWGYSLCSMLRNFMNMHVFYWTHVKWPASTSELQILFSKHTTRHSHSLETCIRRGAQKVCCLLWKTRVRDHIHKTWCFSDRASWIDYKLNTNLMHWLLFIHKVLFSSTCFEPQVLIFRRIQLYTCSIWYCHSLWEFVVACQYTVWVRTDWWGKVVGGCLKTLTNNSTICCMCTTVSSWRWALEVRNMYRRIVFYE